MHSLVLPTREDGIEDKGFMRETDQNQLRMFIPSFTHLISVTNLKPCVTYIC